MAIQTCSYVRQMNMKIDDIANHQARFLVYRQFKFYITVTFIHDLGSNGIIIFNIFEIFFLNHDKILTIQ